MAIEYLLNGAGFGSTAERLLEADGDPGVLRPWTGSDGRAYVTRNANGPKPANVLIRNAPATLKKDEWIHLDTAVIKAAKPRLQVIGDLRGAGLEYGVPNVLGKTSLEHQTQSDIGRATVSMDALRRGDDDRPTYDLASLPLPIIHRDFSFSLRELATSRNGNMPLDTTNAELAARRVAEEAELLMLGKHEVTSIGGGNLYGFTNFPSRLTKTMTAPTAVGWTPAKTVAETLAMKKQSQDAFHYGPWMIYTSPAWDPYLDDDYSAAKGDITLRDRIRRIQGIQDVRTADYLTGFDFVLVQMTGNVTRVITGMDVTTIQWETEGGMRIHFKVMAVLVPQLRADSNGNTGIVHGSAA